MLLINFQSILCGLIVATDLIQTNIDDFEVKFNPVIFLTKEKWKIFPVALKCQKTAIFDDLPDFEKPTF